MFRLFVLVACVATLFSHAESTGRMVCYYDSQSYWREGGGKMDIRDLESALSLCNHLVYGFAKINPDNFNLIPFDESKELDSGRGHFKAITNLKNQFPGLRVLLSVGGQRDIEDGIKYLTLVETPENRHAFIDSAKNLLKQYKFDGLDLAWQFPEVKIKKERGTFSKLWHSIKKAFGYSNRIKDENEELHRQGFSALLQEAKQVFHREGLLLTAAVLPNVNSEIYFETRPTMDNLDYLTLWAFDFKTPDRNKNEADFPSPLHKAGQRQPNETIEGVVRSWIERPGVDSRKIFLGLQTFARTWKLTEESQISGVPPITSDGPGKEGPLTNQLGYLSYSEVCTKTQNPNQKNNQHLLRLVLDPSHRTGSYSWKLPEGDEEGLWVGFQDVPSLIDKLTYVQTKNLGGVAMVELSADDYKGVCTGTKYPLLRAAKQGI